MIMSDSQYGTLDALAEDYPFGTLLKYKLVEGEYSGPVTGETRVGITYGVVWSPDQDACLVILDLATGVTGPLYINEIVEKISVYDVIEEQIALGAKGIDA
jgi:hypothetical protein